MDLLTRCGGWKGLKYTMYSSAPSKLAAGQNLSANALGWIKMKPHAPARAGSCGFSQTGIVKIRYEWRNAPFVQAADVPQISKSTAPRASRMDLHSVDTATCRGSFL